MRPWMLSETNFAHVKRAHYEVAVLPFGATEPHNLHLPYGTDTLEADVIGRRVCEAAHKRDAQVILLPTIPYGTETNMARFPLAMNVNPSTLYGVAGDLVESLAGHGIHKIVLLNSHGGNDFKPFLREMYGKTPAHLFLCDWYKMIADVGEDIFDRPDDHAGEMETSIALAYFPDLVAKNADGSLAADEGATATPRFKAIDRGWISITRPWHLLTTNAGAGDPHAATADKGERLVAVIVERLADFLVELSHSTIDERFPF